MKLWLLVFMFQSSTGLQPEISGPHDLDVCLDMAQSNTKKFGFRAHCQHKNDRFRREYPDMKKDYLGVPTDDRAKKE